MPYGVKYRGRSSFRKRYSGAKRASSLGRKKAFSKARKYSKPLAKVTGRKRAIKSNTRAIKQLKQQLYGPIQTQRSLTQATVVVTASHPALFMLNNPQCTSKGCLIYRPDSNDADGLNTITHFNISTGNKFHSQDEEHVCNGPRMFLKEVELQFKVSGFLDSTHVRIDIIRQKKVIDKDYWNPSTTAQKNFLPHNLDGFANICGFSANEIDRKTFEVLQTRKLYFNSRKQTSAFDTVIGSTTAHAEVDATTAPVQLCTMRVPINRAFKQMDSSVNETTMVDDLEMDAHNEDGSDSKGSWNFDNQHPLANVWCLISTDDQNAISYDGDQVRVDIIRKCVWRDPRD